MKSPLSDSNGDTVLVNKVKRKASEELSAKKKRKVDKDDITEKDTCAVTVSHKVAQGSPSEVKRKKKKLKGTSTVSPKQEKLQQSASETLQTKLPKKSKKKMKDVGQIQEAEEGKPAKKKKLNQPAKSDDQPDVEPAEKNKEENLPDGDNSKTIPKTNLEKNSTKRKFKKSKKRNLAKHHDKKAKKVFESLLVTNPEKIATMASDNSEDATEEIHETPEVGEAKTTKKAKKKKAKNVEDSPPDTAVKDEESKSLTRDLALSYLQTWKNDKDNWSFKKVRQIWLIKNMYDSDAVDGDNFNCLLEYLEGAKGGVRKRLLENAQSIHDGASTAENLDGDEVKAERAKGILQMLSE